MDGSGVHCDATGYFDVKLADRPVVLADIPIKVNNAAYRAYGRYLKRREGSLLQRGMRFFRRRVLNVISDR
jgi:hypothetical protein